MDFLSLVREMLKKLLENQRKMKIVHVKGHMLEDAHWQSRWENSV